MALGPSISASSLCAQLNPSSSLRRCFFPSPCTNKPIRLMFSRLTSSRSCSSTLAASSRRNDRNAPVAKNKNTKKNQKKRSLPKKNGEEDEDLDEDAFEALFNQLEEDLKIDGLSSDDDDDDISEEDLARLERELEEALGDDDLETFTSHAENTEEDSHAEEEDESDDDDDDGETLIELKRWQLRRLAIALKTGRRKTSIKSLAAELCLDRSIVLELLRDPPPNLLLMSATLPDQPAEVRLVPETRPIEVAPKEIVEVAEGHEAIVKAAIHVMQHRWAAKKRLKKVQVGTLEKVYRRTKRPTNAMISSIVHVTNLPRKRVVKWFEDRRSEDGVPELRTPYQRPVPETVSLQ